MLGASKASPRHDVKAQRWVIYEKEAGGDSFTVSSAIDGKFIGAGLELVSGGDGAQVLEFIDMGNGKGYSVKTTDGKYFRLGMDGKIGVGGSRIGFSIFSVTYNN